MNNGRTFYDSTKKINFNFKKFKTYAVIAVLIIIGLAIVSTCWYTVDEKQQGVVTTFGKVTGISDAGMHFKLPFGIQKVDLIDVNVYQKIELGYRSDGTDATPVTITNESEMITGDYNIVNIDFYVEYKVSDPVKYLFNSKAPEEILKNLIQSQIRSVVGSATVDEILTDGKNEIQLRIKELVSETLEEYDIGLIVSDIKIQDSEPPTESVTEAFKAVETAKQSAVTAINQARAYQNSEIPNAEAQADKFIQNAQFLKQSRINEAIKQIAMFDAMYKEYSQNPEITKTRMYYEMVTEAFPGIKLYIDVSDSSTQKLLPIESFVTEKN